MEPFRIMLMSENKITQRKIYPRATTNSTNPTWTTLRSKQGSPWWVVTNHLSHGKAHFSLLHMKYTHYKLTRIWALLSDCMKVADMLINQV